MTLGDSDQKRSGYHSRCSTNRPGNGQEEVLHLEKSRET